MPARSEFGYFQILLRANETDDYPALIDLTYFLHDLNLLYEFSRVVVDPKYSDYRFSRFFAYRNRRRIEPSDQLSVERLSKESPLLIIAVVAALPSAAATLWALVQIFEKIANFGLNREILRLNRDKLKKELQEPVKVDLPPASESLIQERIHIREAEYIYEMIERHLQGSPIRIREIEVKFMRELLSEGVKKK